MRQHDATNVAEMYPLSEEILLAIIASISAEFCLENAVGVAVETRVDDLLLYAHQILVHQLFNERHVFESPRQHDVMTCNKTSTSNL